MFIKAEYDDNDVKNSKIQKNILDNNNFDGSLNN